MAIAVPHYRTALDARPLQVWCRDLDSASSWQLVPACDDAEPACQPTIAPDGERLAVLTAEHGSQVILVHRLGELGEAPVRLTGLPSRIEAPKWIGDPGQLACLGYDSDGWRRVWRWKPEDGSPTPCTPAGIHTGDFTVRPGGDTMAWLHLPDVLDPSGERLPIRLTDLATAETTMLRVPGRPVGYMAWSPDGQWLAYLARRAGHPLSAARLWIVDPARWPGEADAALCLTKDLEGWITGFDWDHDGNAVVVALTQGTYGRLLRITLDGVAAPVGPRRTCLSGPHVDRRDGRLIYLHQDGDAPQRLCLLEPGEEEARPLTDFHEPLAALPLGVSETVTWQADDGTPLDGVLVRPPGATGPTPTLVWLHGGPAEVISRTFSPYFQAIAASGVAVFAPNYRGSNGRGDAFLRATVGDLGGADADDVLAGIDRLVQTGVAEVGRTALMGWSYGATLALLLACKSGVPRAVIAGAPVADWVSFFGAQRYPAMARDYFTSAVWEDRSHYDKASPITHIAALNVPTLFLQGGADTVVPPSHARLLYRTLREREVETDLMLYPGEGHVFGRPSVVEDMLERVIRWLELHLV